MSVHDADIARVFEEIADLLEIGDANPFRVRAYRRAARVIGELQLDAAAAINRGEVLPKLPGIGDDLSDKMREIARTGHCALLDRLRKQLPPAITELLAIPGLGPKRVKTLYHDLDVQTIEQLHRAARDGRIRALAGFGEKTELNILRALSTCRVRARPRGFLRALEHPLVTMLAHPSGRLLESREPYDVDMLQIVRKAAARGRFLELNAHPERLDLSDTYCHMAKDEGVLVSVNFDAHGVARFDNLQYGIGQARRGWLTRQDVLNTRPYTELRALIASARLHAA